MSADQTRQAPPIVGVWRTNQHYVAGREPFAITRSEHDARLIAVLLGRVDRFRPCVAQLSGREWRFAFHVEDNGDRGTDLRKDVERYDKGRLKTLGGTPHKWTNVRTLELGAPEPARVLPLIND